VARRHLLSDQSLLSVSKPSADTSSKRKPKPMDLREFLILMKTAFVEWYNDNGFMLGAALAYYAVFAISPLLLIALSITGVFYRTQGAAYIEAEMAELLGANAAKVIAGTITSVNESGHGTLVGVISGFTLSLGATGVFIQLQEAMNFIWGVTPKPGRFLKNFLTQRLISFVMVLGFSFLLLVSLLLSAAVAAATGYLNYLVPSATFAWQAADVIFSFGVVVFVFAAVFKVVPDVRIDWADVWVGALVTGVLFTIGKTLISSYLGTSSFGSAFGAAGSVLVILAWVYYSSQVLFIGAEFTKVYAESRRPSIHAVEGAKPVTKDAKARDRGDMTEIKHIPS
jgi:membrane protein